MDLEHLDKNWNRDEKGGLPLCRLPFPEPGATYPCPACKTQWHTIEQDGKIVWTNTQGKKAD